MKVDKGKFDALLGRLIKADPQKRSETKPDKKRRGTSGSHERKRDTGRKH